MYIAARNEQRALDAIKQLETEGIADGKLEWLQLDLSDPRLAKQAAKVFLEKESRLDILGVYFFQTTRVTMIQVVLVNNAAMWVLDLLRHFSLDVSPSEEP